MRSLLSRIDRLLAPAPDPQRTGWLTEWTYAHRGLHGAGRVENSPSAFRAAIAAGLGIECDIQRSSDGEAMVFHDWDFARLAGRPDRADALTREEWRGLRLLDSDDAPHSLPELLALVAGQVPLLIEIKSRPGYDVVTSCRQVMEDLQGYHGPHAVMSFDPRVARWLRRHAPATLRGLVMREDDRGHTQQAWQRHLALWIARPDFMAYHIEALPTRFAAALRGYAMPLLTWTVKTSELRVRALAHADALIAEGEGLP